MPAVAKRAALLGGTLLIVAAVAAAAIGLARGSRSPDPPITGVPALVGAGDIASCGAQGDDDTARLLDEVSGTVFTTGDNAYPSGTAQQYDACYEATWGRHRARTRPAAGNHDYHTDGAAAYFEYFGAAAGEPGKGYYSYDLGAWHVVVLNSNCIHVGGCDPGSPQFAWLEEDLAANPTVCSVAYWHHPPFSSGRHGGDADVRPFWRLLYRHGADVVITGHDHTYERFARQDGEGGADPERGIRLFVVGTGGGNLYQFRYSPDNSEVKNNTTFGVLKLTLHDAGYDWEFIPTSPGGFTDSGSASCSGADGS